MYNMFIAKREICDEYCQWLFPLLLELEEQIDPATYNPYQARLIGRVGELLLDVMESKKITFITVKYRSVHGKSKLVPQGKSISEG